MVMCLLGRARVCPARRQMSPVIPRRLRKPSFHPVVVSNHVHLDIEGPLPVSHSYRYILTMVDHFPHWPEAVPIHDITAETVSRAFIYAWVSRFRCPGTVKTDRERQFESSLFACLNLILGARHCRTTVYHPCANANGMVERLHRQLKTALTTRLNCCHLG